MKHVARPLFFGSVFVWGVYVQASAESWDERVVSALLLLASLLYLVSFVQHLVRPTDRDGVD